MTGRDVSEWCVSGGDLAVTVVEMYQSGVSVVEM